MRMPEFPWEAPHHYGSLWNFYVNGEKPLLVKGLLSYVLLCQLAHSNNDDGIASVGKEKSGNEDEDLESRLPKTRWQYLLNTLLGEVIQYFSSYSSEELINEKADIINKPVWLLPAWRAAYTVQMGWSTLGSVQGQVGWDPVHPDLLGGIPAQGRGSGTRWT